MNWVDDNLQTALGILGDLQLIIRDERRRRGISLRQVGEESGVSYSWLWRLERGERNPSREVIEAMLHWALQSRQIPKPAPITPGRNRMSSR